MSIHLIPDSPHALSDLKAALFTHEIVLVHAVPQIHFEATKPPELAPIYRYITKLAEEYQLIHVLKIEIESVRAALKIQGNSGVFLVFKDESEIGRTDVWEGIGNLLSKALGNKPRIPGTRRFKDEIIRTPCSKYRNMRGLADGQAVVTAQREASLMLKSPQN
jgi:hypothetical protein